MKMTNFLDELGHRSSICTFASAASVMCCIFSFKTSGLRCWHLVPSRMQASRRKGEVRLWRLYTILEQQVWAAYDVSAVAMRDA
jgi:hypothetical protein